MAKSLTIELSDAAYKALRTAAEAAHTSPEQLVATTVVQRFDTGKAAPQTDRSARDAFIQFMRERGVFVDPACLPPHPPIPGIPAYGTPEWDAAVKEIEEDTEDDVDWSRVNFADWVERR